MHGNGLLENALNEHRTSHAGAETTATWLSGNRPLRHAACWWGGERLRRGNESTAASAFAQRNPWQFSTKYLDAEVETVEGLYYYGYRHYVAALGRWPSRDPLREGGGLNFYAFLHNNGIDALDDLGLAEHRKGARPSTKGKHQKGQSRQQSDQARSAANAANTKKGNSKAQKAANEKTRKSSSEYLRKGSKGSGSAKGGGRGGSSGSAAGMNLMMLGMALYQQEWDQNSEEECTLVARVGSTDGKTSTCKYDCEQTATANGSWFKKGDKQTVQEEVEVSSCEKCPDSP